MCQQARCHNSKHKNNVTLSIKTTNKITRGSTDSQSSEDGEKFYYRHAARRSITYVNSLCEIFDVRMVIQCDNYTLVDRLIEPVISDGTVLKQNTSFQKYHTLILSVLTKYTPQYITSAPCNISACRLVP